MNKLIFRPMRLILFFDLPVQTKKEQKAYRLFHDDLLKNGYIMLQFSVYIKVVNVSTKINDEIKKISKKIPQDGNIRLLTITEKQFQNMKLILGNKTLNEIFSSAERFTKI